LAVLSTKAGSEEASSELALLLLLLAAAAAEEAAATAASGAPVAVSARVSMKERMGGDTVMSQRANLCSRSLMHLCRCSSPRVASCSSPWLVTLTCTQGSAMLSRARPLSRAASWLTATGASATLTKGVLWKVMGDREAQAGLEQRVAVLSTWPPRPPMPTTLPA
jgi:hypothetical protein